MMNENIIFQIHDILFCFCKKVIIDIINLEMIQQNVHRYHRNCPGQRTYD
jgi:hypothetical protein